MDTHRWPRATTADEQWGRICRCGNLKTDQALTCTDCAVKRRRAIDYWERRTCKVCGGPKSLNGEWCVRCEHDRRRAHPEAWDFGNGGPQPEHPWRKAETARRAA
jgi:hypothetical protein